LKWSLHTGTTLNTGTTLTVLPSFSHDQHHARNRCGQTERARERERERERERDLTTRAGSAAKLHKWQLTINAQDARGSFFWQISARRRLIPLYNDQLWHDHTRREGHFC